MFLPLYVVKRATVGTRAHSLHFIWTVICEYFLLYRITGIIIIIQHHHSLLFVYSIYRNVGRSTEVHTFFIQFVNWYDAWIERIKINQEEMLPKFVHVGSHSHSKIASNIDSRQVAGIIRHCQTTKWKRKTQILLLINYMCRFESICHFT